MEKDRFSTVAIGGQMGRRNLIRFAVSQTFLFAIVTTVFAGGWAVITLNEFPEYAVAGKPVTLTFSVRQHGVTLLSNLQPVICVTSPSGVLQKIAATAGHSKGEYTATVKMATP